LWRKLLFVFVCFKKYRELSFYFSSVGKDDGLEVKHEVNVLSVEQQGGELGIGSRIKATT
jgi:hypothetical protein